MPEVVEEAAIRTAERPAVREEEHVGPFLANRGQLGRQTGQAVQDQIHTPPGKELRLKGFVPFRIPPPVPIAGAQPFLVDRHGNVLGLHGRDDGPVLIDLVLDGFGPLAEDQRARGRLRIDRGEVVGRADRALEKVDGRHPHLARAIGQQVIGVDVDDKGPMVGIGDEPLPFFGRLGVAAFAVGRAGLKLQKLKELDRLWLAVLFDLEVGGGQALDDPPILHRVGIDGDQGGAGAKDRMLRGRRRRKLLLAYGPERDRARAGERASEKDAAHKSKSDGSSLLSARRTRPEIDVRDEGGVRLACAGWDPRSEGAPPSSGNGSRSSSSRAPTLRRRPWTAPRRAICQVRGSLSTGGRVWQVVHPCDAAPSLEHVACQRPIDFSGEPHGTFKMDGPEDRAKILSD